MQLGYIVLAHESFEKLAPLLSTLCQSGDQVVLHLDASQSLDEVEKIKSHFPDVKFAKRIKVEWGESSIVQATLNAMEVFLTFEEDYKPDYISLVSGSCMPIKPRSKFIDFLSEHQGQEFIECHDVDKSPWVIQGYERCRWEQFCFFNMRKTPKLFALSHKIQKKLGVKRKFPFGEKVYMGSQWWTLSFSTVKQVVEVSKEYNLMQFIRSTSIPDEFFFQTLVAHLVEKNNLHMHLMHYRFNAVGIPKIYTIDDLTELKISKKFFSRKLHHPNRQLIELLSECYQNSTPLPEAGKVFDSKFQWYKKYGLKAADIDCPLPIIVIIDTEIDQDWITKLSTRLKENACFPRVFGELFAKHSVDYHTEQMPSAYSLNNVIIRDFDRHEFIYQIALNSPTGFLFFSKLDKLDKDIIDSLRNNSSALFIDVSSSFDSLDDIQKSEEFQYSLKGHWIKCKYKRLDNRNLDSIATCIDSHLKSNLFLKNTF